MIENRNPNTPDRLTLEFEADIASLNTSKILFNTKVKYSVTLATLDPKAVVLATMKASQRVKVTIEPIDEPEKANEEKQRK